MRLTFVPIHVFRETPKVMFFDASVPHSNGSDIVEHSGDAVSPPDDTAGDAAFEQYYRHRHQVDHNLVLHGTRSFRLLNPHWPQPHHVVHLERAMGALQIPIGTYHRSESGAEGSLRERPDLQALRQSAPWVWCWRNGHICRHHEV